MDFNSIFSFFSSSKGGFSLLWRFSGLVNLKESRFQSSVSSFHMGLSTITDLNPRKAELHFKATSLL